MARLYPIASRTIDHGTPDSISLWMHHFSSLSAVEGLDFRLGELHGVKATGESRRIESWKRAILARIA
jgi:hypothetical protein